MKSVAILGDSGAGKSSLLCRWVDGVFNPYIGPSIGNSFKITQCELEEGSFDAKLIDFPGTMNETGPEMQVMEKISGAIIVIDLSNQNALNSIFKWVKVARSRNIKLPIAVFANKTDARIISSEMCQSEAQKYNAQYNEISVKMNEGIDEAFGDFMYSVYNFDNKEFSLSQQPQQPQQTPQNSVNDNENNNNSTNKNNNDDITQVSGRMEIEDAETEGGCCRI